MAKLVFPSVDAPYMGFIGEVRGWFDRIASYAENSPGAVPVLNTQLDVLAEELGFETDPVPLPSNQAVVTHEDVLPANDNYIVTLSVVDGVVTATVTEDAQ